MGSELQSGIDEVSYSLEMKELKEFEVSKEYFMKELNG